MGWGPGTPLERIGDVPAGKQTMGVTYAVARTRWGAIPKLLGPAYRAPTDHHTLAIFLL